MKSSLKNQGHSSFNAFISTTLLMGFMTSRLCFAAESGITADLPSGVSQAEIKSEMHPLSDTLFLNYFGTYHGPNLTTLDSPYATTATGKPSKQATYLDGEVNADYLINPNTGLGPVVPFFLYTALGQGASLGDVGLKLFQRKTLSTQSFSLNTNLIIQLPTSDGSRARDMKFAIKTSPSIRYLIPNSRFTLGSWTEAKTYLGVNQGKTFKLWAGPYVNYQLTPSFSLNLEYELEGNHFIHKPTFDFAMVQNDFMPGFIYQITPKIMVNPYVQIFTGNNIAFASDHMALGAMVSATL